MRIYILNMMQNIGLGDFAIPVSYSIYFILILAVCLFLRYAARFLLNRIFQKIAKDPKLRWVDILLDNKIFEKLSNLIIPLSLTFFKAEIEPENVLFGRFIEVALIIFLLILVDAMLKSIEGIYNLYEISKNMPIHGFIQVVEVVAIIAGVIVCFSILRGESPAVLLGGIGAMTAVTSLIFKDAILGFIAGIQLTGNDMIRIGDWIEVPKYSANGTVVDLSMTTVKVENFNKTLTLIPAYMLVSDSFINWRGMVNAGARQIKRSIYIDAAKVCVCDGAMLDKFKKIALLTDYINGHGKKLEDYNASHNYDLSELVNGRRLTNLGVFRIYVTEYLKQHPGISTDLICMVRQLEHGGDGIPLEIYAFTNTTVWLEYEDIQADIFDHLYAVISEFGLSVYQNPSGNDIRQMSNLYQLYTSDINNVASLKPRQNDSASSISDALV